MRYYPLSLILLIQFLYSTVYSQNLRFLEGLNSTNLFNETYGNHELNTFDIFLPESKTPTPLVIYIHGGGFKQGDKRSAFTRHEDIEYFIQNDVAFATINYGFMQSNDSIGVRRSLDDMQHAIQFIIHHSKKYNLKKKQFALYGHSAGAGASLYFAYHDDFANHKSSTYLKESTKPVCVGAIDTQATYDVFKWKTFVPTLRLGALFKRSYFYNYASDFYGYPNYKTFKPYRKKITQDLDMLSLIDGEDPPSYIINLSHKTDSYDLDILHDSSHADALKKQLKKHKVEHYIYTHKNIEEVPMPLRVFLVKNLK